MASIVFCGKCGSSKVDIKGWIDKGTAVLRCCECDNEAEIHGFTVGRVMSANLAAVLEAAKDMAICDKYNTGIGLWYEALQKIKKQKLEV